LGGNDGYIHMNEDRPVLSETELYVGLCTFQQCIDHTDVAGRSSARESAIRLPWVKMAIFNLYTQKYLANGK